VSREPNTPVVTILTPAFNSTAFLAETIRSAQEQTFSNFELLIVDDSSTDDTFELARQFSAADPRICVYTVPHGGSAAARNAAIAVARGRFFALLDSDDVWAPHFLEEQLGLLEREPGISIVSANVINRGGAFDGRPFWSPPLTQEPLRLLDLILHEDSVCIFSVFRREVTDRIGGFDSRFASNEDYHFWLRAAAAGFRVLQNPALLGFYRRHAGSLSANEPRMLRGISAVLRDIAANHKLTAEERSALDRQLERFEDELLMLDVREYLKRGDGNAAVQSLRNWAKARRNPWVGAASTVASVWPQPIVWLYDLRRTLRAHAGARA
jgi:glycosyltransferase involved in cell wall biosynthesis